MASTAVGSSNLLMGKKKLFLLRFRNRENWRFFPGSFTKRKAGRPSRKCKLTKILALDCLDRHSVRGLLKRQVMLLEQILFERKVEPYASRAFVRNLGEPDKAGT